MKSTMANTYVKNPGTPYIFRLPGGMFVGRCIRLKGSVNRTARSFFVDFQCGPSVEPSATVAFQLAFLFLKHCLERNHYMAEQKTWGFREHSGAMPLRPGDKFIVDVSCEEPGFMVQINGKTFCEFSHRLTFDAITHMFIQGDVEMEAIEVLK